MKGVRELLIRRREHFLAQRCGSDHSEASESRAGDGTCEETASCLPRQRRQERMVERVQEAGEGEALKSELGRLHAAVGCVMKFPWGCE